MIYILCMLKSVKNCLEDISRKDEEIDVDNHYSIKGAKVYDAYYGNMEKDNWTDDKKQILDKLIGSETDSVMCLACGPGRTLKYIDENYDLNSLYGLDYSSTMVSLAKERNNKNVKIKEGSFRDLNFIDKKFDLIYMLGNPINHYTYEVMDDILPEVFEILDGKFIYDFIKHEDWKKYVDLNLGSSQTEQFLIPRASCNRDNEKLGEYYKEKTDMIYQIRDKYNNNINQVNIKDIELYSHPTDKHYNYLEKYNYNLVKEKDKNSRKILYCSNT